MIHGQKRNKKERPAEAIKEEDAKSEKINAKLKEFFELRKKQIQQHQIPALLEFTSLLMQLCSDIPTIFNFRREIFEILLKTNHENIPEKAKILTEDYKLNTKIIQSDPKSYTLWTHRQWLIQKLFEIDPSIIQKQKQLCKKLLQKDEKNFHVWNYRSWANSIKPDVQAELAFTQQKIKENPFNFSPYHFRSQYLQQKFSHMSPDFQEDQQNIVAYGMPKHLFEQELQGIQTALFLKPNEQAPWNFYNWLLGQLIPALLLKKTKVQQNKSKMNRFELIFSMKISNPAHLILPDEGEDSKNDCKVWSTNETAVLSEIWFVECPQDFTVLSTSQAKFSSPQQVVKLQNPGHWVIGSAPKEQQLSRIHTILSDQIKFVKEVEESEENKCRFGWLQIISIRKALIMSRFFKEKVWEEVCNETLQIFDDYLKGEVKGEKYIAKIKEFWHRLKACEEQSSILLKGY